MINIEISPLSLLILGTVLTFLATWFWRSRSAAEAARIKERERTDKLVQEMALISMQLQPFWSAVQTKIASDLTHPSPQFAEMDLLLKKLEALTITSPERSRLEQLLRERVVTTDPEVGQSEKDSAGIMLGVMRQVITETKHAIEEEGVNHE